MESGARGEGGRSVVGTQLLSEERDCSGKGGCGGRVDLSGSGGSIV